MSISSTRSESPLVFSTASSADSDAWVAAWKEVQAKGMCLVLWKAVAESV